MIGYWYAMLVGNASVAVKLLILIYFCLIEVRAMVVAVQQPLAECTFIFTVVLSHLYSHRPPPCAVTIHKTYTDQLWSGF